jgi:PAS domain S-box-containing protein
MGGMKSLWELLWNYDPNGLIVVDRDLIVRVVNPALCSLFSIREEELVGAPVSTVWEDTQEFTEVWETGNTLSGIEKEYPALDLYVRKLYFPVKEEGLVACIVIDLTKEWKQREELQVLKRETIQKVHTIVDKQMSVAQKIAGLLGETTAETKVSLLKLMELVEKERL